MAQPRRALRWQGRPRSSGQWGGDTSRRLTRRTPPSRWGTPGAPGVLPALAVTARPWRLPVEDSPPMTCPRRAPPTGSCLPPAKSLRLHVVPHSEETHGGGQSKRQARGAQEQDPGAPPGCTRGLPPWESGNGPSSPLARIPAHRSPTLVACGRGAHHFLSGACFRPKPWWAGSQARAYWGAREGLPGTWHPPEGRVPSLPRL